MLAAPVSASQAPLEELIERGEQLDIHAPHPETREVIGALIERLDEADVRQTARIRIMQARNMALDGDFRGGVEILRRLLEDNIDPDHRLRAKTLTANMTFQLGSYHDAFEHLQQALEQAAEVSHKGILARTYSLAAYLYREVGETEQGVAFAERALELARETGQPREACIAFEKVGLAYEAAGNPHRALQINQQALEACQRAGDPVYTSAIMVELGHLHHELGNYQKAQRRLVDGLDTAREVDYIEGLLRGKFRYGRLLFSLEQYEQARRSLTDVAERIESRQRWRSLEDAHHILAQIAIEYDEHARAYEHLEQHLQARQRDLENQRARLAAFHEVRFNARAKERELELMREQARVDALERQAREQQRLLSLIGYSLIGVLVVTLLLLVIQATRQRLHYRQLSRQDSLTALNNHTRFFEKAAEAFERAQQQGTTLFLVLADIDHFKQVNDQHGHLVGDEVLRRAAARLREVFGDAGPIGRIGGEEFAMIVLGEDPSAIRQRIDRLREQLRTGRSEDAPTTVTMSFGIASLDSEGTLTGLRKKADQALYAAKHSGRDSAVFADGTP